MFKKPEPPSTGLKDRIAKHLRTADEFFRFNRFEEALIELEKALELDPKNNYARSFQERIRLMQKRALKPEDAQVEEKQLRLEERLELISQLLAAAEQLASQKEYKQALEKISEVYKIDPKNYYAQSFSDRIKMMMAEQAEEATKIFRPVHPSSGSPQQNKQEAVTPPRGNLFLYRELLKEVWLDGKVTEEEARQLQETRDAFNITIQEHQQLERETKIEAYVDALRIAWQDGYLTENERKVLEFMRNKYGVTPEEHANAEVQIQSFKQANRPKDMVLIIDPDRESLVATAKVLRSRGYNVVLVQKAEDSFPVLQKQIPALILCEAVFPEPGLDGFGFYKKVREHSGLKRTPFFFISKVNDEKIVRAGLRVGVDHFIKKPVDTDYLMAAIEGKLRP